MLQTKRPGLIFFQTGRTKVFAGIKNMHENYFYPDALFAVVPGGIYACLVSMQYSYVPDSDAFGECNGCLYPAESERVGLLLRRNDTRCAAVVSPVLVYHHS